MPQTPSFSRQYVILRPLCGSAGGFLRLEMKQGRMAATIRASQLPAGALRALLLSGDSATGAVIDLGRMRPAPQHHASLYREGLPAACASCHTVVVCTDWPEPQLMLYGHLFPRPACTLWQLQESVRRYLAVPPQDASLPAPAAPIRQGHALCMLLPPR